MKFDSKEITQFIFWLIILALLIVPSSHDRWMRENAPCEDLQNYASADLPARCISYYEDR